MDAGKILALQQPLIAFHVPGNMACIGHDLLVGRRLQETALAFREIALILERQTGTDPFAQGHGAFGRRLALRMEMQALCGIGIEQGIHRLRGGGSGP